jgi:hypothetical protein
MPIFECTDEPGLWQPSELAAGPFAGLQGGAIAGLLTGEIEAEAANSGWGSAISASVWFLRPTPAKALRTRITPVHSGGRISVVDNMLWVVGDEQPCAIARVTLTQIRSIEIAGYSTPDEAPIDPTQYALSEPRAPHGGPWFMDAMEVRSGPTVRWFKLYHPIVAGGGPLAQLLGPADWAHGINRPIMNVVADPNPNLNVQLMREPQGEWIGVEAQTRWQPDLGIGMGGGILRDALGIVGRVSMSVALTPFPKASK